MIHRFVDLVTGGVFPYQRNIFDGTNDYVQVWGVPPTGGAPVQLGIRTANGDQDLSPCASPDGNKVAYVRGTGFGSYKLYVINADGSGNTLLDNNNGCAAPTWHPDGTTILYRVNNGIVKIQSDGTGRTDITPAGTPAGENLRSPLWNHDGSQIVFQVDYASALTPNELWTMNPDGTGAALLVAATRGGVIPHSCAPTNNRVAYVQRVSSNHWLRRINLDGTNQTDLVGPVGTTALSLMRFAWAPDESVVYYADTSAVPWTLKKAAVNGSGATSLSLNLHNSGLSGPYVFALNSRLYFIRSTTRDLVSVDLTGGDLRVEDIPDLTGPDFIDLFIVDSGGTAV